MHACGFDYLKDGLIKVVPQKNLIALPQDNIQHISYSPTDAVIKGKSACFDSINSY